MEIQYFVVEIVFVTISDLTLRERPNPNRSHHVLEDVAASAGSAGIEALTVLLFQTMIALRAVATTEGSAHSIFIDVASHYDLRYPFYVEM